MIKTGDITYKEVGGMTHGRRPCVVIGVENGWAHLVPISTSDWNGQPYIRSTNGWAKGYAAPNRYHKTPAAGLQADGWVTHEDAATLWDLLWA